MPQLIERSTKSATIAPSMATVLSRFFAGDQNAASLEPEPERLPELISTKPAHVADSLARHRLRVAPFKLLAAADKVAAMLTGLIHKHSGTPSGCEFGFGFGFGWQGPGLSLSQRLPIGVLPSPDGQRIHVVGERDWV